MAASNLKSFLQKLDAEMQQKSEIYRKTVSNKKPHTFYVSKEGLYQQVLTQAASDGVTGASAAIKSATNKYFTALKNQAVKSKNNQYFVVFDLKVGPNDFSITFQLTKSFVSARRGTTVRDTFELVKEFKNFAKYDSFITEMRNIYKGKGSALDEGKFLDMGHAEESAVIKQRIYDSLTSYGEPPKSLLNIEEVSSLFTLLKNDSLDTITVSLESAAFNQLEGTKELKGLKNEFQDTLQKAIQKLEVHKQKGSDSLETKKVKEVHNAVTEELIKLSKKSKRVRTNIKSKKILKSKKSPVTFKNTSKVQSSHKGKKASKASKAKQSNVSLIRLIGILNQQLPEQVAGNMESPRLNYRTGRFASSVRVTDITQTAKGFPSIGYTYMKYPYQTFEPGYAQGDVNRDPRKLIDASIREIAAQFAIGRFYTRRV